MSIQQAVIATSSMGVGGAPAKSATWGAIYFEPIQEGQQQHITVNFSNWDNTSVYWSVHGAGLTDISTQLVSWLGVVDPGFGNSTQDIYFTFNADATTDGPLEYYFYMSKDSYFANDILLSGPYTVRDSSQAPAGHSII